MKKTRNNNVITNGYDYLGIKNNTKTIDTDIVTGDTRYKESGKEIFPEKHAFIINNLVSRKLFFNEEKEVFEKIKKVESYPERFDLFEIILDVSNELLLTRPVNEIDDFEAEVLENVSKE